MDVRESIVKQNEIVMSLAKHVIGAVGEDSNFVFSPATMNAELSLIAAGSGGSSRDQIVSFLNCSSADELKSVSSAIIFSVLADGSASGGPNISAVTGVWIDESLSFKPSFKELMESSYKAVSNQVDFQTKAEEVIAEVNSWVEKQTNGLIKNLLPIGSVNEMTRLVFANALYFKGAWNEPFDASQTKDDEFHLLNGTTVRVPFMTSKKRQYLSAYDGFKVLQLPYRLGGDMRQFSMFVYLPNEKHGLPALLEEIASTPGFFDSHRRTQEVEVGEFRIPKFKFSSSFEASKVLKSMGLTSPFTDEGGLTEMIDSLSVSENLYVSSIFHKSFIEVNEEGTEAAAASVGVMTLTCLRVYKKLDFVADHPFLFVVRENMSGVILFIGQVLDPLRE